MERRNVETTRLFDLPVVCPAGERVVETQEGPASHCRIEQSIITAAKDPGSLATFCMGAHELCPTWQAAREAEWDRRDPSGLMAPGGAARAYAMDDLNEIAEREEAGDFAGADERRREILQRKRDRGLAPGLM
jgi:hypothetical protein